jgi:hypothetical protein
VWRESNDTAEEIADALQSENPPIIVSARTIDRDIAAVRSDGRRYFTAANFDGRFEVGTALTRHELIARKATQRALSENGRDAARWAREFRFERLSNSRVAVFFDFLDAGWVNALLAVQLVQPIEQRPDFRLDDCSRFAVDQDVRVE